MSEKDTKKLPDIVPELTDASVDKRWNKLDEFNLSTGQRREVLDRVNTMTRDDPAGDAATEESTEEAATSERIRLLNRFFDQAPDSKPKYRVLHLVGRGGMGTVYKAEQRIPVKRLVAIKLVKPGFDSKEILARFESERQALA